MRSWEAAEAAFVDEVPQVRAAGKSTPLTAARCQGCPRCRAPTAVMVTGGSSTPLRSRIAIAAVVLTPLAHQPASADKRRRAGGTVSGQSSATCSSRPQGTVGPSIGFWPPSRRATGVPEPTVCGTVLRKRRQSVSCSSPVRGRLPGPGGRVTKRWPEGRAARPRDRGRSAAGQRVRRAQA